MEIPAAGLGVVAASAIVNATYPLPLKFSRDWKWENNWLVFTLLALLAVPCAFAALAVPHFGGLLREAPPAELMPGFLLGSLWGVAQVTFGVSLGTAGMAMAFAILVGVTTVVGSVIPLAVLHPAELGGPRGGALSACAAILAAGLILYARAAEEREAGARAGRGAFGKGFAICLFTGALAGLINLGFAFSGDLMRRSECLGASPLIATFAVWPVVLAGGSLPNLAYTGYLLIRRRSARRFVESPLRDGLLAVSAAALWVLGVYGYGVGASLMGRYGTSAGYAVFQTVLMLWSTALGVATGEWRGARPATTRRMSAAVALMAAAADVVCLTGV